MGFKQIAYKEFKQWVFAGFVVLLVLLATMQDIMTEVHRRSPKSWFTISTLDVWRTKEGLVLPRDTSVTYRNPQTGAITSNRSNTFSFTRVGDFDLPETMLTVKCSDNFDRNVGSIKLSNH